MEITELFEHPHGRASIEAVDTVYLACVSYKGVQVPVYSWSADRPLQMISSSLAALKYLRQRGLDFKLLTRFTGVCAPLDKPWFILDPYTHEWKQVLRITEDRDCRLLRYADGNTIILDSHSCNWTGIWIVGRA